MTSRAKILFPLQPLLFLGVFAAIAQAAFRVALPVYFVDPLVDDVFANGNFDRLLEIGLLGLLLMVLSASSLWLQDASLGRLAAFVTAHWRKEIYQHLLKRYPLRFEHSSGGLSGRLLTDLKDVEPYLQFGLGTLVTESFTLIGVACMLFVIDYRSTLILLVLVLPIVLAIYLTGKKVEAASLATQEANEQLGHHIQEGLKQLEVVRSYHLFDFLQQRFARHNQEARAAFSRRALWAGLQTPLVQVLSFILSVILLIFLTQRLVQGQLSAGELSAYLALVVSCSVPIQLLPRGYALMLQASSAASRLIALLATVDAPHGRQSLETPIQGLEASELGFAYQDGQAVLRTVSFVWQRPSLVVIQGESGQGKTTLIKLLLGLLRPSNGELVVLTEKRQSLAKIQAESLYQHMAYVPQESLLFSGSIRDNLAFSRSYTDEQLWSVLRQVQLENEITSLDYLLSEEGRGLSGGQRQRLALARSLMNNPEILLLDEPTANLDHENEELILKSLLGLSKRCLVVVVSHRRAVIEIADSVYTLKDGLLEGQKSADIAEA